EKTKSDAEAETGSEPEGSTREPTRSRGKGLGIRGKMFFLFVLVPISLIVVGSLYTLTQLQKFQSMSTEETHKVMQDIAVSKIAQKSQSLAKQIEIYLDSHPDLREDEFIRDAQLRQLAVQKIGAEGYSFLYTKSDASNAWRVLVHFDREMLGADISAFSEDAPRLKNILTQIENNNQASGYYNKRSSSGEREEHYIHCSRVGQTDYFIATTSKLNPLTKPVRVVETRITQNYKLVRKQIIFGLGVLVVIIFLLVSWFAHRLTNRIFGLADVAERISVGDLTAEIKVKGRDEIGMLADSIGRMQQSVRLSIERLRRHR
ncbi:MAG: HAMP domain-containing protein, partial [Thermodesulfobacteriota bacterium]